MGVVQQNEPATFPKPPKRRPPLGLLMLLAFTLLGMLTFEQIVEWVDGEPRLRQRRQNQMEQELQEIDEAEQYVLVAKASKDYPCLKCPSPFVHLNPGEVWKYGVTRKGMEGRYKGDGLTQQDLEYIVQFIGDLKECLKQEKAKIYQYPLMPENLARPTGKRLVLPPGNLRTD